MTVIDMTQDEPVQFRVRDFGPSPVTPNRMVLSLELVNHQATNGCTFDLDPLRVSPYVTEIKEAIDTQMIYWVDWSRPKQRPFPPPQNSAHYVRVLLALKNRQILPDQLKHKNEIPCQSRTAQ